MKFPAIWSFISFTAISILLMFSSGANALEDGRLAIFDAKISPDGESVAFSWVGDIWIADVDTGECSRVTDHVAYDYHPVWFPDSTKIAFTSNRDGNDDVYSVPISGGQPIRHTWYGHYDQALDVSPDGENILFRTYRKLYSSDLFEVDIHGGLPRPVTMDEGVNREACYSSDGSKILVSRGALRWTRRDYNGSGDSDLYVMDRDGENMRWIEYGYDGLDYWPCYGPGDEYIYFISDRDGIENVWRIPADGGTAEQLTHFTDSPVLFLSVADTGRISFIQGFHLWVMDPGEEPEIIDLDCASEPKHSQEVRLDISGNVSEIELSPLGTHLALIARGELFITQLHEPDETAPLGDERFWESIRVTDSVSRERHVAWHPDGDRVVLISDSDGNQEVYEIDLRTYEWTQITHTPEEEYMPIYSPNGDWLSYYRGNDKLVVRNLSSGVERVVVDTLLQLSPWPPGYAWSPDSRWIGYTGTDAAYEEEVFVVRVDGDDLNIQPVNITLHHDNDYFAGWAEDGNSIYFLSNRGLAHGLLTTWGWWGIGSSLYSIPLRHEPAPRSDILEFIEEPEEESDGEDDEDEVEVTVEIDFERIDERARLVSPTRGGGWRAILSPDSETFIYDSNALGVLSLWSVPYEGGSAEKITELTSGLTDMEWLPDGKGVVYLSGRKVYYWDEGDDSIFNVPVRGRLTVDLALERNQMIHETGRILSNHFYDAEMHGIRWNDAIESYSPFVEEASSPEEFAILMQMLFGELDASHLGCWTSRSSEGIGANPGFLGLEFDPFTEGQGLRVTKVWPRGPADYAATRIRPGEWVLEINGVPVSTSMNYWQLLDDSIARSTELMVASDQEGSDTRMVVLAPARWYGRSPISYSFYEMIYFDWVETKREIVEDESENRIGYVHISGMSGPQLERFAQELFAENYDKDALIIDVRFNGGGNTHEQLLDILSRPQFGWSVVRDGEMVSQPSRRWDRPTVLLINERSYSDAEIFPAGFRALGLGTIIGEATFGAVIGTWNIALVDGVTYIRVPRNGWYTIDGENMENLGIQPDIRVVQDLNHLREGIDDQLNYAVEYLLEQLE